MGLLSLALPMTAVTVACALVVLELRRMAGKDIPKRRRIKRKSSGKARRDRDSSSDTAINESDSANEVTVVNVKPASARGESSTAIEIDD